MDVVLQPISERTLGDYLLAALRGDLGDFKSFEAAIAFVKRSGVQHIGDSIRGFIEKGGKVCLVVGIDQHGTSAEGLTELLAAVSGRGEIWIHHDENSYITFHPKVYLFEGDNSSLLLIGSGNLTEGGLYSNDEASAVRILASQNDDDAKVLQVVKSALAKWRDATAGTARQLDAALLQALIDGDYVRTEVLTRPEGDAREPELKEASTGAEEEVEQSAPDQEALFRRGPARRRPPRRIPQPATRSERPAPSPLGAEAPLDRVGFVMTLMQTDVGVGQTTPGTAPRSPEIFIPLRARDANREFWEWPSGFTEDPAREGKFDRFNVPIRLGGETIHVNMMIWPVKHDFRLRSGTLRSAGEIGDILRMEKTDPSLGYVYYVEIIPKGTSEYERHLELCSNSTPNSRKQWGYYNY